MAEVLKMAEYINKEEYCENYCRCSKEFCERQSCPIWKAPAADVAPVRHGTWNNLDGYKTRKACSVCGWDVPEYGKFYSYCPNCGAKMGMDRGGENASKEM